MLHALNRLLQDRLRKSVALFGLIMPASGTPDVSWLTHCIVQGSQGAHPCIIFAATSLEAPIYHGHHTDLTHKLILDSWCFWYAGSRGESSEG